MTVETSFRDTFLMTFRMFTTADVVIDMITRKYEMEYPEGLSETEFMDWKDNKLRQVQSK